MRLTAPQGLPLILLCAAAVTGTLFGQTQTAPKAAPPTPTSPKPQADVTQPDELQWSAEGASAQCRDGTFFHGTVDKQACADHGGVRKLLSERGQDLIR